MPLNNENNNECCKCTTPEYEIILNQQGPQGRQGNEGKPGFSPQVTVVADTYAVYQLNITTEEGQITTPNLKATIPLGGQAGTVLTKNSGTDGDASWQILPNASQENAGIVELATIDDLTPDESGEIDDLKAVTPDLLSTYVEQEINKVADKYVTLDTEQTITGQKTFDNLVNLDELRISGSTLYIPNSEGGIQSWDLNNEASFYPQWISANPETDPGALPGFVFLGNNYDNTNIQDNKFKNAIAVDINGKGSTKEDRIQVIREGHLANIIASDDIATTSKAGIVKPDGTTITVDGDGTIHSVGGGGDLSNYYNKTETDDLLDAKQDVLTTGEGIGIDNDVISIADPNLYFFHYGTQYGSTPITNSGNTIVIQRDIPIITPNGTFSYTNQISFTYNKSYSGHILACKDGSEETYYIVAGVYYGGEQPTPNENDSIAWFDKDVWKLISTTGEVTELSTQLVTPLAYVILYNNSVRFVYYPLYYKVTSSPNQINKFQFTTVTNNDNLNKYCYPGCWYFTNSTNNSNKPVADASGYLIVYRAGNGRVLQVFYRSSNSASNQTVYYRLYVDKFNWSPWKQILTSDFNVLLKNQENTVTATTMLSGGNSDTFNLLELESRSADSPQLKISDNYGIHLYANGTNAEIAGGYGDGARGTVATEGFRLQTELDDGHENGLSQLYLASEYKNRITVDTENLQISRRAQGASQPRKQFDNIDTGNLQSYIVAGDNITVTPDDTGKLTIAGTGSGGGSEPPANMVTTDTDQTITGTKTFGSLVTENISAPSSNLYISATFPTISAGTAFDIQVNSTQVFHTSKTGMTTYLPLQYHYGSTDYKYLTELDNIAPNKVVYNDGETDYPLLNVDTEQTSCDVGISKAGYHVNMLSSNPLQRNHTETIYDTSMNSQIASQSFPSISKMKDISIVNGTTYENTYGDCYINVGVTCNPGQGVTIQVYDSNDTLYYVDNEMGAANAAPVYMFTPIPAGCKFMVSWSGSTLVTAKVVAAKGNNTDWT